ncbi:MAG: sugar phosphate isomerase/epimerase [Eubacteriales bacterium]|nr:sugar phosphate isomerase/epimerase [Eubacteriales bacterium]
MKIGFVSAILDDWDFREVVDIAADMKYRCIELACWPKEKAQRRYAGVSHLDVAELNDEKAGQFNMYLHSKEIELSSLAYYPNVMGGGSECIAHLYQVMEAAKKMHVNLVSTFIGRVQDKTVEENLDLFERTWIPIVEKAENLGIKIAIENCPMLFGKEQWPGGQNLAYSPAIWREMFRRIPSSSLGLNYDPSHFVWQHMDYLKPVYEFKERIFHVHCKDIKLYPEKLSDGGVLAYPLEYMSPKLPGLGDVDWRKFVSALTDIGYDGALCIEIEDKAFETSKDKKIESLRLSKRYIEQFII